MPRLSRELSPTGRYHSMLRGINKQKIFFDKQDIYKFINELERTKEKYNYELYAYCLMPNHVHLEIYDKDNCIGKIMQSLAVGYVSYFNQKYERVGHLFQNRYLSKTIEYKEYLMNLIRYIHQNPEKAGICKTEDYQWSSYKDYIYGSGITDTEFILSMFSNDKSKARQIFKEYNKRILNIEGTEEVLDYEILTSLEDDTLINIIKHKVGINDILEIQKYNKKHRDKIVSIIKGINGTTNRQISRVLEIDRKLVDRVN